MLALAAVEAASYPIAMDEMLDIVNTQDEVVGQAARSAVHRDQLMHRATHVILMNSSKQVFMQLRSKSKDTNPGLWDTSAAGHVDAGESYTECAVRELHEELGVLVEPEKLQEVGRVSASAENGFEFVRIYAATSDDRIRLQASEIDDGKWVSESELDFWLKQRPDAFAPTFSTIWQRYQAYKTV